MKLTFVKLAGDWFVHLPDFPDGVAELVMVDNAHTFLEYLDSFTNTGIVTIGVSTTPNIYFCRLSLIESDDIGATYKIISKFDKIPVDTIWLCNVTKYIFDEFPKELWITI